MLHEIYLPAFEAAVTQAKAASVMCSYSTINGDFACQNPYLETTTLRNLWDFPGFVTSDYGALHEHVRRGRRNRPGTAVQHVLRRPA